jgi:hypothetical protein
MDAELIARRFHDTYERLAPSFGYETRADTKAFDPTSPNGKLMTAVCGEVAAEVEAAARADERLAVAGMRRSVQEAVALIDEINKRATSRAFYGIGQVLHGKLATIRATLAIRAQKEPSA